MRLPFKKYFDIFDYIMKKTILFGAVMAATSAIFAQGILNASESDPNILGWMRGFPPEKSKVISAVDGSFFEFPALRYSVNHMREFYPTRDVPAAHEKPFKFKTKIDPNIDKIKFTPWDSDEEITWENSLAKNYTDGIIIVHKGKIVYEKYFAGLKPEGLHAAMSVSKSFAGTLAAILVAQGKLDADALVTDYIPELHGSGYEGATVQQVMDMRTAISYSEDYNDPNAEVWAYALAGNVFRPANYSGPKNYYEYLPTLKKIQGKNHGEEFAYKTVNTELLGWIISRATGKGIAELLSEMIWQPMGAQFDAYYNIDPAGIAMAGGGLSLNLRDMAAFGEMMLRGGRLGTKQVIPFEAANDIAIGGTEDEVRAAQKAFAKGGEYPKLEGWSYRDMWWRTNNSHGAYMARGVHGQAIYIDPAAQMVIVRFASSYLASNKYIDPLSIPAYEAVAEYLMKK